MSGGKMRVVISRVQRSNFIFSLGFLAIFLILPTVILAASPSQASDMPTPTPAATPAPIDPDCTNLLIRANEMLGAMNRLNQYAAENWKDFKEGKITDKEWWDHQEVIDGEWTQASAGYNNAKSRCMAKPCCDHTRLPRPPIKYEPWKDKK
jgi:hypothetical protein